MTEKRRTTTMVRVVMRVSDIAKLKVGVIWTKRSVHDVVMLLVVMLRVLLLDYFFVFHDVEVERKRSRNESFARVCFPLDLDRERFSFSRNGKERRGEEEKERGENRKSVSVK